MPSSAASPPRSSPSGRASTRAIAAWLVLALLPLHGLGGLTARVAGTVHVHVAPSGPISAPVAIEPSHGPGGVRERRVEHDGFGEPSGADSDRPDANDRARAQPTGRETGREHGVERALGPARDRVHADADASTDAQAREHAHARAHRDLRTRSHAHAHARAHAHAHAHAHAAPHSHPHGRLDRQGQAPVHERAPTPERDGSRKDVPTALARETDAPAVDRTAHDALDRAPRHVDAERVRSGAPPPVLADRGGPDASAPHVHALPMRHVHDADDPSVLRIVGSDADEDAATPAWAWPVAACGCDRWPAPPRPPGGRWALDPARPGPDHHPDVPEPPPRT